MMMVDRYDPWFDGWDGVVVMDVEDDGDWVTYDDYQAQAARIEQLEAALIASITLITISSDYEITVKELLEKGSTMKDARETIADICDAEIQSDNPSCYVLADAILAAMPEIVGAMVEPLVWENWSSSSRRVFSTVELDCKVTEMFFPEKHFRTEYRNDTISTHPTIEAAKQAANDHRRAQVLGALGL